MHKATAASILVGSLCGSVCAAAPLTLQELKSLSVDVQSLALSADGAWLATAINGSIEIRDIGRAGHALFLGEGLMPQWCPGSGVLAFYSRRGGQFQLWTWRAGDMVPRQITQLVDGIDPEPTTRVLGSLDSAFKFSWAPDCSAIVFSSRAYVAPKSDRTGVAGGEDLGSGPSVFSSDSPATTLLDGVFQGAATISSGMLQLQDGQTLSMRSRRAGEIGFSHLFVADIRSGKVRQLTADGWSYFGPDWASDGRTIIAARINRPFVGFAASESEVVSIDPLSGETSVVIGGGGFKWAPALSPDRRKLIFEQGPTAVTATSLRLVEVQDERSVSAARVLTDRVTWGTYFWLRTNTGVLVLQPADRGYELIRISVEAHNATLLPVLKLTSIDALTVSGEGSMAWFQADAETPPGSIEYRDARSTRPRTIQSFASRELQQRLGHVMPVSWRNSEGIEMQGSVLLPPGRRSALTRSPLIVDAYPLAGGSVWTDPMGGNYAWASMGYIVFRPGERSPNVWNWPGRKNVDPLEAVGPHGWDVALGDILTGVDALIRRGMVDETKMCLFGHSNGGAAVNFIVTRTSRFRCAISVNPAVSDWVRYAMIDPANEVTALTNGVTIEENLEEYVALSAVFHLKTVETPMLLGAGALDTAGLLDQIEMFNGLRRLGRDVTLVKYPNSGHNIEGAALEDLWNRETKFLERYLIP